MLIFVQSSANMDEDNKKQQSQNNCEGNFQPEVPEDALQSSLQKYEVQRLVLEKILDKIPVESRETVSNKDPNKRSILQLMKRKLHLILLLAMLSAATQLIAQNSPRSTSAILFQEDFNGWNAGSIAANGWSTITSTYNYISPEDDMMGFFKQDNATWMLLITPGVNLTTANMLIFDYKRYSSVAGMKFKIGVMTDPMNTATFTMLDVVEVENSDWLTDTVFLSGAYRSAISRF